MADEPATDTDDEKPTPMKPPEYHNDPDTMRRVLNALRELDAA